MADAALDSASLYRLTEGLGAGELVPLDGDSGFRVPAGCLLDQLGIVLTRIGRGTAVAEMTLGKGHLNQRGIAQAGAIVALADATAGWASYSAIEHGGFTTLQLSTNLLRAGRAGDRLVATAKPVRLGRRVQVIDVFVAAVDEHDSDGEGELVARFTCNQLVLEPKSDRTSRDATGA